MATGSVRLAAAGLLVVATAACGKKHVSDAQELFPTPNWLLGSQGSGSCGASLTDAPGQAPVFVPTVELFKSCQAIQDKMRPQWGTHTQYYSAQGRQPWGAGQRLPGGGAGGDTASRSCSSSAAAPKKSDAGASEPSTPDAINAGAAAPSSTFTNVQEKGVDEADTVKIGDHHVYVLRGQELQVIQRGSLALLGALPVAALQDVSLYAEGDTLVVIGKVGTASNQLGQTQTHVQVFHVDDGKLPTLVREQLFDGETADTRMVGQHLIMVFRDELPWRPYQGETASNDPITLDADGAAVRGIPCEAVLMPAVDDGDTRMVKLVSLDTANPAAAPQFTAAIGGGDQIFMSSRSLYLTKQGYFGGFSADDLLITRVDFDATSGALKVVATGAGAGRVKDQFAFEELTLPSGEPVLALATTLNGGYGGSGETNQLAVYRQNETKLEIAGLVGGFGNGEDIRSVRYVDSMAYVVTFMMTDPLYAIDLHDPLNPKLLGSLEMPGFSLYMHPVAPGRLLGVGFDATDRGSYASAEGLQVSLFDVGNPVAPLRLSNLIVGQRGSFSDVTSDHHAFFYDPATRLVGLPAVEFGGGGDDLKANGDALATTRTFSGAIFYRVGDTALSEVGRVSHFDLIPPACQPLVATPAFWLQHPVSLDVNRVFLVDGKVLTVSRFGVKAQDPAGLGPTAATQTIAFPPGAAAASLCPL